MRGSKHLLATTCVILTFIACRGAKKAAPPATETQAESVAQGRGLSEQAASDASPTALHHGFASAKLIRTGGLSIEVVDFSEASERAARIAKTAGGYVAESRSRRAKNDRQTGSMTIRVPADQLDRALAELRSLGKVTSENINAQDVTKEYADLETRLSVKRETADRLRAIMKQRTARLSDVLEVERELARVTEEIERMEGERRYYDHRIALSTITLNLFEAEALVRSGLLSPIRSAFTRSLELLVASFVALLYVMALLVPWLAVAAVLFWIVRRLLKKRSASTSSASS